MSMKKRSYRGTTFGGEKDLYDLAYAPGRFYALRAGETPAQYYRRIPAWMRTYFRPEMADATEFPLIEAYLYRAGDVKNKVKKYIRAGLSYWLNAEKVIYFAWHEANQSLRRAALEGRAWLRVTNDLGVVLEGRVIDHGPSGGLNDLVDMSPAAHRILSCDGKRKNIVSAELFYT